MNQPIDEFSLISDYFKELTGQQDVAVGIGDDAAIIDIKADKQIAVATDTLVASVHFPNDASAEQIATRALCVNLSDMAAMGATPVFMPVPALPQALSKGVVDGAVIPWEITIPLKISELVKNHLEIPGPRGLYTSVFIFAMNKAKYESLPDDLKKVIDDNSGMAMAKWVGKVWDEIEAPGLAKAKASGTVRQLSPSEVAKMREVTASVTGDWIAEMNAAGKDGAALLKDANRLIDQYTK